MCEVTKNITAVKKNIFFLNFQAVHILPSNTQSWQRNLSTHSLLALHLVAHYLDPRKR